MNRALSAALLILSLSLPALAETISVEAYTQRLVELESALRAGELERSRAMATALSAGEIRHGGALLQPDASVLQPIVRARTSAELPPLASAVRVTLRALQEAPADTAAFPPKDSELLERLRDSEMIELPEKGGDIAIVPIAGEGMWDRLARWMARAWDWLVEVFEKIYDWIRPLLPEEVQRGEANTFLGMPLTVALLVGVILLLLVILAIDVHRKRKRGPSTPDGTVQPLEVSARDADPLSREMSEWERYALELAAAGRVREAIRAWYHAVLVALYRGGILHYRKGRTNWEYIASLSPDYPWRGKFVAMTRLFEQEWYGHELSSMEALDVCATEAREILSSLGARA